MTDRLRRNKPSSAFFGTTQTKVLGVLALASLALSFAVGLKTSSAGLAFLSFIFGALILLLTLYDIQCVQVGGCGIWSVVKAILVGVMLVGVIMMQIGALGQPKLAPLQALY